MDDSEVEALLRKYRPTGPPPRLRERILALRMPPSSARFWAQVAAVLPLLVAAGVVVSAGIWLWLPDRAPMPEVATVAPASNVEPASGAPDKNGRGVEVVTASSVEPSQPSSSRRGMVDHGRPRVTDATSWSRWLRDEQGIPHLQLSAAPAREIHVPLIEIAPLTVHLLETTLVVEGSS